MIQVMILGESLERNAVHNQQKMRDANRSAPKRPTEHEKRHEKRLCVTEPARLLATECAVRRHLINGLRGEFGGSQRLRPVRLFIEQCGAAHHQSDGIEQLCTSSPINLKSEKVGPTYAQYTRTADSEARDEHSHEIVLCAVAPGGQTRPPARAQQVICSHNRTRNHN
jgi:hypothetical protein